MLRAVPQRRYRIPLMGLCQIAPTREVDMLETKVNPIAGRILSFQRPDETDRAFALRIGVASQNIANWKNLGMEPSRDTCERLAEENGWRLEYLLLGKGQRYRDGGEPTNGYAEGVRDAIYAVLHTLRELNTQAARMDGKSVDFTEGGSG